MKKLLNFLFSFPFMGILLLILAFSMAIATFVESDYGTEAAKGMIYNAFWLELIFILLAINLGVNFIRHKLYTGRRIAVGLFHISFLIILIGAGITRYISFEGVMHIREGQSSDFILSSDDYLEIRSGGQTVSNSVLFSELTYKGFHEKIVVDGRPIRVKSVGFIKNAILTPTENPAVSRVSRDETGNATQDAVILEISDGSNKQTVNILGRHGERGEPFKAIVGNSTVEFTYGAIPYYLPFSLHLTDFQLEKYPGSESPSSFASELILNDKERNVTRNVRVFMNNTLSYRGYKFFQSSYDQDEGGTILSVNADAMGTAVTYLGYSLLALGFILALFSKKSRFHLLIQQLKRYTKPVSLALLFILTISISSSKAIGSETAAIPKIDKTLLNDFSRLWIQGLDGRIEPVSTLASEILRKVSRQSDFDGRRPEEVMLGLYLYPEYWRNVALVKVSDKQLMKLLGVTETRIPITTFFDEKGNYKLLEPVKAAFAKMPAFRNVYEKEVINLDERVNICFMVMNGDMFSLFPGPTKATKWYAPGNSPVELSSGDSLFVNRGLELLKESFNGKRGVSSRQIVASIASYQNKFAAGYLPSDSKKNMEIIYNSLNPFKRVFPLYLLVGFTLLIVLFVNIFRQKTIGSKVRIGFTIVISLGFLLHTLGLVLRWYVSGHAPWSDGYESMVYVAWATMLAGVIFGRKYPMVIGSAAMLSGIILFVAHLNWMNPEITHLVPVLNSYWLMIHVAIITASYGFIGMSAFIGLLVLVLFSISNPRNSKNIKGLILQLTTISEMSVTIGLYMLTIGTFLGGVWANESWGRYWGWDSKETWALITVVVYSFIAHMHLIPSLKGIYNYSVATVIGFSSVLMTYFGVNYYLTGLHSYGKGSVDSVHWSVFVLIAVIAGILIISNFKQKNLEFEN